MGTKTSNRSGHDLTLERPRGQSTEVESAVMSNMGKMVWSCRRTRIAKIWRGLLYRVEGHVRIHVQMIADRAELELRRRLQLLSVRVFELYCERGKFKGTVVWIVCAVSQFFPVPYVTYKFESRMALTGDRIK